MKHETPTYYLARLMRRLFGRVAADEGSDFVELCDVCTCGEESAFLALSTKSDTVISHF